jgi:hypothetical protein
VTRKRRLNVSDRALRDAARIWVADNNNDINNDGTVPLTVRPKRRRHDERRRT